MKRVLAVILSVFTIGTMGAFAVVSTQNAVVSDEKLSWVFDPSGGMATDVTKAVIRAFEVDFE